MITRHPFQFLDGAAGSSEVPGVGDILTILGLIEDRLILVKLLIRLVVAFRRVAGGLLFGIRGILCLLLLLLWLLGGLENGGPSGGLALVLRDILGNDSLTEAIPSLSTQ